MGVQPVPMLNSTFGAGAPVSAPPRAGFGEHVAVYKVRRNPTYR
jgi:hypothetical protein